MKASDEQTSSLLPDSAQRFLFEGKDIRGEVVSLQSAYQEILAIHQYAPGVSRLLGEFLAAAVLLSSNLKFEGKLILQVRSKGQIPLLMAECDHTLQIRGIARGAEHASSDCDEQLLGGGQLAITVDPNRGQRYQGIVPLQEDSLARSLDAYFEHSEQLGTRMWLAADGERAAGLLLQQLPTQLAAEETQREQQWDHCCTLAATTTNSELLGLGAEELLYRLYHEDQLRLFQPLPVKFHCSCSRERTLSALSTLGRADIEDLLNEQEIITMDCEFCNQQYDFTRTDLTEVLTSPESKTLH